MGGSRNELNSLIGLKEQIENLLTIDIGNDNYKMVQSLLID